MVAFTENVYGIPPESPFRVTEGNPPAIKISSASGGSAEMVYEVISLPPSSLGGVKVTDACSKPADAFTADGAAGTRLGTFA